MLEKTWGSAYQYFKNECACKPSEIIAIGKSLGDRIASQMVAQDTLTVDNLIFLGYPLHAPGKKEQLRDAHLYDIDIPILFFAGTRDSVADLSLLKDVLSRLGSSVETINGGDHSFNLPRSGDVSQEEMYERILRRITDCLKSD